MPRSRLPARLIRSANRPSSQRSLLDLALSRLAALFPKHYKSMLREPRPTAAEGRRRIEARSET